MTIGDWVVPFENLTGYGAIIVIAVLVITRKLVWHTDLTKAEERADRWEEIALKALGTAEKLTVTGEIMNKYLEETSDSQIEEGEA